LADALDLLRASLRERLVELRGDDADALSPALLDLSVQRFTVGEAAPQDVYLVAPRDWEQLRHEEGGAGRPVPYWARPWPSGLALAGALADAPPLPPGTRVLELGCGLGAPSVVAARAGAEVLATDGVADAVAFAAHALALNEVTADVAQVDWAQHGEALVARGPFDVLLAADVLYLQANVEIALRLWPRLLAPGGVLRVADPHRAGTRDFLAAARATFSIETERRDDDGVALHVLRSRDGRLGGRRDAERR